MNHPWYGLIELFVVLAFVIGWAVLELVVLHLEKRREAELHTDSKHDAGHAKG